MSAERDRVKSFGRMEAGLRQSGDWYRWGPYVSERQWGTVREDYSPDGEAWDYLPHDHARSRAYRWGEDGLAGFCDVEQRLCLGLALWNGRDPILKERAFGLTGAQGNHGEDVKDYWWYLDAVPSHAWNRWRYHYPQGPFPYEDLIEENASRDRHQPEYELLDTGVFSENRYWAVEVCYAKDSPDDLLMAISVTNQGPEADTLHVLPTAWFRNTWSWDLDAPRPGMAATGAMSVTIDHPFLGRLELLADPAPDGPGRPRRRGSDGPLLRERDEHPAPVRHGTGHPVPEGRHQRPRDPRDAHGQPGTQRHQVRLLVQAHRSARPDGRTAAAAAPGRPRGDGAGRRRHLVQHR